MIMKCDLITASIINTVVNLFTYLRGASTLSWTLAIAYNKSSSSSNFCFSFQFLTTISSSSSHHLVSSTSMVIFFNNALHVSTHELYWYKTIYHPFHMTFLILISCIMSTLSSKFSFSLLK